jgi:hypothetical protein
LRNAEKNNIIEICGDRKGEWEIRKYVGDVEIRNEWQCGVVAQKLSEMNVEEEFLGCFKIDYGCQFCELINVFVQDPIYLS